MDINQLLERIALAFEEQNRINQQWVDINTAWHNEAEALTEKRYQEKRETDDRYVELQQTWHDEAERLNELRYQEQKQRAEQEHQKQVEHESALLHAYLERLKEQAKE